MWGEPCHHVTVEVQPPLHTNYPADRGNNTPATDQLGAYVNKLEARKRSRAIAPSIADQLIREATNIADRM